MHKVQVDRARLACERAVVRLVRRPGDDSAKPLTAMRMLRDQDVYNALELDTVSGLETLSIGFVQPDILSPNSQPVNRPFAFNDSLGQSISCQFGRAANLAPERILDRFSRARAQLVRQQQAELDGIYAKNALEFDFVLRNAANETKPSVNLRDFVAKPTAATDWPLTGVESDAELRSSIN